MFFLHTMWQSSVEEHVNVHKIIKVSFHNWPFGAAEMPTQYQKYLRNDIYAGG